MSYDGWLNYNGVELVNLYRTVQLAETLGIDTVWTPADQVSWIQTALDPTFGFGLGPFGVTPFGGMVGPGSDYANIADAPWFDPGYPASAEFAGIVPLSIAGLDDSSLESSPIEYITDGGSAGKARNATQTIVCNVAIVAATDRGAEFGKRWLDRVLRDSGSNVFCSGADLRFFRYTPSAGVVSPPIAHRRNVKLTRGTSVTRKRLSDCSATWLVTFTLVSADPYIYGEPIPALTDLGGGVTGALLDTGGAATTAVPFIGSVRVITADVSPTGFTWEADFLLPAITGGTYRIYPPAGSPTPPTDVVLSDDDAAALSGSPNTIDFGVPVGEEYIYIERLDPPGWKLSIVQNDPLPTAADDVWPGESTLLVTSGSGVPASGSLALLEETCPTYDYSPIYDPLYAALVPSPTAPEFYPAGWEIAPGMVFTRFWARTTPVEPSGLNVVPAITLTTDVDARMVRVAIWPSESDVDDQCDPLFCAIVSYLPAGVQFIIDGEQRASYVWDGSSPFVRRADSLVYGTDALPVDWTAFNDHDGLLVTLDVFSDSVAGGGGMDGDGTIRAALALIPKSD